jgi:predicted ATPase/class 3 adenylate cyclase
LPYEILLSVSVTAAPSGVVTFLFTDIEGSTRRWEADADAMRSALTAHDEVLRSAIEAHGGLLFKHTGDGVVAAFASPLHAVEAAIAAQRALELPVRMGLATGEAEPRGGDYFGTVLNRAARVMACGHGGQVLVAGSTAGLLAGIDLVDLGPRRLRDLPSQITLFQVKAPGLREEFPPLRTLDATPGNLRRANTSFIGRDADAARIEASVRTHRLVTLTGVGGIGKTRLALEVAHRLGDEFPAGVWLFELAAVTDPAAVPDAVAVVLGISQQAGMTVTDSVAAALDGRVQLLVFDNCEHVLGAAADFVEAILARSATVKVLATSREGLGVFDEQLWPVSSLDVARGIDSSAAALFLERAQSVVPDLSIGHADQASVVEICRRLDGIPLAIELAASRMASMTAGEVRARLDNRFRLLVGARRGLERHQTLRQAVAWSFDLLGDAEKVLLARCSVFMGGFELQSACAVAGFSDSQEDDFAILDLLDALVRKSLLVADRSSGRTRFSILETIRQFAEEQLVARGEAETIRRAHAHYFAGREPEVFSRWDTPQRLREVYDWFTTELANLRAAFRWAADQGDLDAAATIATYASMLGVQSENYEPIAWAEELVEPARAAKHPRLAALYAMASMCYMTGSVEAAVRYADAGRLAIDSGEFDEVPYGQEGVLGGAYCAIGQPERAVEWCHAQLARGRDTNGVTTVNLVFALMLSGRDDEAMAAAAALVDATEATHNPWALSFALFAEGYAFSDAEPDRALPALRRGLAIARDTGSRYNTTVLAVALSRLEARHGDPLAAFDYIAVAIRIYHDSGNLYAIRVPLAILAALFDRLGRYEPVATVAGFAAGPLTSAGIPELNTAIAHLREVLGDHGYDSLAHKGESMTIAAMTTYAFDQIDQELATAGSQ